jgi:hypothetical protein
MTMDALVGPARERDLDQRARFWRRYGLAVYWLPFALYTVHAAHEPGLVVHRATAPYSWVGLIATWVNLALEVAFLGWILKPRTFHRSWGRLAAALAVYAVLAELSVLTFTTDMPGYYYVPFYFHMVTFVGLFVLTLVTAVQSRRGEES